MEKLQQQFIAWLIKKGYKPHPSNITHLHVGYIIGVAAAAITLILLFMLSIFNLWVILLLPMAVAFAVAYGIGYWKEKRDGENFDRLDLFSTAVGGLLAGAIFSGTLSLFLFLISKFFI